MEQSDSSGSRSGIKVFFGRDDREHSILPPRSVLISPLQDDWNDFGWKTRCRMRFYSEGVLKFTAPGFIGFLESDDSRTGGANYLRTLIGGEAEPIAADSKVRYF